MLDSCFHCGCSHTGVCPRIKSIEYFPNGTIKKVEYFDGGNHTPSIPISPPSPQVGPFPPITIPPLVIPARQTPWTVTGGMCVTTPPMQYQVYI